MTDSYSPPSGNPGNLHDPTGTVRLVLTKFLQSVDDMLPAQIVSYDRSTNMATVQPLLSIVTTDNRQIQRAQIVAVPVLQLGGGGFVISFPLNAGDLGWIKANDGDISIFNQIKANVSPNTGRLHSFEDAMFIPDSMMRSVTIAGEDANRFVIQNLSGSVKISWGQNDLRFHAPSIGAGGSPNTHAILDLQSTTQAVLLPRMTTVQRNAIPSPVEGMIVWNLDTHGLSVYTGTGWT